MNDFKQILDACCGSRMFWFDKQDNRVVFMDNRSLETTLCDGRTLTIKPDIIGDFRDIPYPDKIFRLVVFDPPHLLRAGEKSWLAQKYGRLDSVSWSEDIRRGFCECFRVLSDNGVLVFKWNEDQIKLADVVSLAPHKPLFGQRSRKTHWLVFMKESEG